MSSIGILAKRVCRSTRIWTAGLALLMFALVYPAAFAQMDFTGDWRPSQHEDSIANPYLGEWVGMPMSAAARARAETWEPSIEELPEWQCRPHNFTYISRGPSQPRIWKEVDPLSRAIIAWRVEFLRNEARESTPIWMDGRPHPSADAPHTWSGFSTGVWEGHKLRITTDHLSEGYYRRSGEVQSDQARLVTYWIRHGDYLVWATIAYDPIYLTEPLVRSSEEEWAPDQEIPPYPCTIVDEETDPYGTVESYMPGTNTFTSDWGKKYQIPESLALGGADTMYPEAERKLIMERNGVTASASVRKTSVSK